MKALVTRLAVLLVCAFTWSDNAAAADPTARTTTSGDLVGASDGLGGTVWMGIPFAHPPVGDLRWRAPQPPALWAGVREAKTAGSACMQPGFVISGMPQPISVSGSEDCLYLNIHSPAAARNPDAAKRPLLPVLFWIHGGGNTGGEGQLYDGRKLAANANAIVVNINYRLGVFGWLSHGALRDTATTSDDKSGNYGVLDMVQALHWVRANIAAFGGDPAKVTIFGESAGGWNVFSLLFVPQAKGLFHAAIVQSGGDMTTSRTDAENLTDEPTPGMASSSGELILQLLQKDGAPDRNAAKEKMRAMSAVQMAAYLRGKTFQQLMDAYHVIYEKINPPGYFLSFSQGFPQMFLDGAVLPSGGLHAALESGAYAKVPIIIGNTRDEYTMFLNTPRFGRPSPDGMSFVLDNKDRYSRASAYLSRLWKAEGVDTPAALMARHQPGAVFAYRFDWADETPSPMIGGMPFLARHGMDLPFTFGTATPGSQLGAADVSKASDLTDAIMSYWGAFARDGKPGKGVQGTLPTWKPWSPRGKPPVTSMLLNSQANGGLRIIDTVESKSAVIAELEKDPALGSLAERCQFFADLLTIAAGSHLTGGAHFPAETYKSFFSAAEYGRFMNGACAAPARGE